jgi:hypothetical protein
MKQRASGHEPMLRFLDHQMAAEEVAALADRLRADETARRQTAALLLQVGVLAELARPAGDDRTAWQRRPRVSRPRGARWTATALALSTGLVAAAVLLLIIGRPRTPVRPASHVDRPVFARATGSRGPVTERPSALAGGARALLVRGVGAEGADVGDQLMTRHLEALGFEVTQVLDETLSSEDLSGKALVVISASTNGPRVRAQLPGVGLREAPVPIVTCESATFDLLGMTGPRVGQDVLHNGYGFGSAPDHVDLQIEAPGHFLAVGLQGRVPIASAPVALSWGHPAESAIRVASLGGSGRHLIVQFAYERGATMVGVTAPARRVGCFISAGAGARLTADAWRLFDAGVRWASGQ